MFRNIVICMAIYLMVVAARIERLNVLAGGVLPRQIESDQISKWRLAPSEFVERDLVRRSQANGADEDQDAIRSAVQKNIAEHKLKSAVESFGLIQYPIGVVAITIGILGLGGIFKDHLNLWHSLLALASGAIALGFASFREYWSSLGW